MTFNFLDVNCFTTQYIRKNTKKSKQGTPLSDWTSLEKNNTLKYYKFSFISYLLKMIFFSSMPISLFYVSKDID